MSNNSNSAGRCSITYNSRTGSPGQRVTTPSSSGLCPLHQETRPSFYVNARKNLFYCHGCGQGGDLIRFVELSRHLSFRQSLAYLEQQSAPPVDSVDSATVLNEVAAFYQEQLDRYLRHCVTLSDADCTILR